MLFAYGREMGNEVYCDRAFDLIEQCKAEKNAITKHWEQYGIKNETAGESQALIQQQREYCDKRRCTPRRQFHIPVADAEGDKCKCRRRMTTEPSDFFIQSQQVMFVHGLDDYPFRPFRRLVYPDLSFGYLNLFHASVPSFIDDIDAKCSESSGKGIFGMECFPETEAGGNGTDDRDE